MCVSSKNARGFEFLRGGGLARQRMVTIKFILSSACAGLPSHADGGMNFFDSWINKMVVRVGS